MTIDPITANTCQDFCSEDCNVGANDAEARHRSSGVTAVRGGLMGDKTVSAKEHSLVDIVPSVAVEQHPFRGAATVVLHVNPWIADRQGWALPGELIGHGPKCVMTPERAEHLAEILIEHARIARNAQVSAERVTA